MGFHAPQQTVYSITSSAATELGGVARPACEEASVRLSGTGNLVLS